MAQVMYNFFSFLPDWLVTFLLAMLPITELRVALPFSVGVLRMPLWEAFIWSVAGNILIAIFLVCFIKPVSDWLSRHSDLCRKFFDWWFNRALKNFNDQYVKYGAWGLMVFVAIPLPATGAWTGAVAAFLFKIPARRAIIFISLGVIIAGIIVSLLTGGFKMLV